MFWKKKNKTNKNKTSGKPAKKSCVGSKESQSLAGDALRAQALANARTARNNIGEDAINKFAEMMEQKENSTLGRAKRKIQAADSDRVLDELKWMLDDR